MQLRLAVFIYLLYFRRPTCYRARPCSLPLPTTLFYFHSLRPSTSLHVDGRRTSNPSSPVSVGSGSSLGVAKDDGKAAPKSGGPDAAQGDDSSDGLVQLPERIMAHFRRMDKTSRGSSSITAAQRASVRSIRMANRSKRYSLNTSGEGRDLHE